MAEKEAGKQLKIDISIIMPVYNHEKYIRKALDSILAQKTSYRYEVLVGEDGSKDHSADILKEYETAYPDIFRVFYRKKNLGATKNVYELLMSAKGRYIASLEGDDYWTDAWKLQKQADFLETNRNYIGTAGNFSKIDGEGNLLEKSCIPKDQLDCAFTWDDFLKKGFVFQTASVMYRNIYQDGGDYSVFYKAHDLVGDLTVLTLLLNRGDFFILPDELSAWRYVVRSDGDNAASIASRDRALSMMKTILQYVRLVPYLKNERDYEEKIAACKADFFVKWLKRHKGYTNRRLQIVLKTGNKRTNIKAAVYMAEAFAKKLDRLSAAFASKLTGR